MALFSLISLFIFTFKRRSKLAVPFLAGILFALPVLSIHAADSVVQATADAAGLTPVSGAALPGNGTFWVMTVSPDGSLIESPYPFLPANLSTLPIYLASGDKFIVDDTGGQIMPSSAGRVGSAQAMSTAQSQAVSMAGLIDLIQTNDGSQLFQPNGFTPMIDTNGLWLEASNENNGYLGLRAHNTIADDNTNCFV